MSATAWNKAFVAFETSSKSDMISSCDPHDDIEGCWTNIDSPVFARARRSKASSATPRLGSSRCCAVKKNGLRVLRPRPFRLVRPEDPSGTGQVLRRRADLSGDRDPEGSVPELRYREAGEAVVSGRQPVLHQTLRLLRQPPLPDLDPQGRGQGASSRLEHGQGPRDAVYAGAAPAEAAGKADHHRHRRDCAAQGPCLPDRRQRLGPASAAVVRGRGSLRGKPGQVLHGTGFPGPETHPAGRHGHVEGLLQVHPTQRPPVSIGISFSAEPVGDAFSHRLSHLATVRKHKSRLGTCQ